MSGQLRRRRRQKRHTSQGDEAVGVIELERRRRKEGEVRKMERADDFRKKCVPQVSALDVNRGKRKAGARKCRPPA